MATLDLVLVLVAAVVLGSWVGRLVPSVAPPLVQIALGALMGSLGVDTVRIDPELFFVLFLPPLLFLDGWRLSGRALLKSWGSIASLAVGLVIVTVLCVGPGLHAVMPQMPLIAALALAAVLSPTDAIAGMGLLRGARFSRRIIRIVEGEALLNDASALICLHAVLLIGSTDAPSAPDLLAAFAWVGFGGLAIGGGVGFALLTVKNAVSARLGETTATQILISLLFPYAAYHAAVALGASGILAPVAAGMVMGRTELGGSALPLTRLQRAAIWETLAFTLNGVVFVLLGERLPWLIGRTVAAVPAAGQTTAPGLILLVLGTATALTLIRLAWFTAMTAWHDRGRREGVCQRGRVPTILAATFSGARGAVTLAAALALPVMLPDGAQFPARDLVIATAAGVILVSLILANVALPLLARSLSTAEAEGDIDGQRSARLRAAQAAIAAVERVAKEGSERDGEGAAWQEASTAVLSPYRRRFQRLDAAADTRGPAERREAAERHLRIAALHAERAEIAAMVAAHRIDDETARLLLREVDGQEAGLGG